LNYEKALYGISEIRVEEKTAERKEKKRETSKRLNSSLVQHVKPKRKERDLKIEILS
jgi:hypothetical protein